MNPKHAARLWLVLPLLMAAAPHAWAQPPWIGISWLLFALWSLYPEAGARVRRWAKLPLTLTGAAGVLLHYGTVFGPQGGVALLVFLSGAKLLEAETPRDRTGLLFVGCFLLVAHFLEGQSLLTAGYMVVAALALVAGLIANQQPRPATRPTLVMASRLLLQALPLAVLLFVLFPRLQNPLWGLPRQGIAHTGLSDRMSPGDFGQIILSDEIALRAEFAGRNPTSASLYWRGPVLWDFNGRTWRTGEIESAAPLQGIGIGQPIRCTITLEPQHNRWLILLGLPTKPPDLDAVLTPDLQWLAREPVTRRLRYEMWTYLDYRLEPELGEVARTRALRLPPESSPRALALARGWAARSATDTDILNQALALFRSEPFFYTLRPPLLGAHPVDDFLFESRRGFCEHYASAFVFLMRAAGVPARVVTGYQGGEFNQLGNYWIVRGRDAHAWAEVWLAGRGWMRVDPTAAVAPSRVEQGVNAALPAAERPGGLVTLDGAWLRPLRLGWDALNNRWNQWVLGYNQESQRQFLSRLTPSLASVQGMIWGLTVGGGLILAGLSAFIFLRQRPRDRDPVRRAYARFSRTLARLGITRRPAEAPEAFARRAAALRPDLATEIERITRLYLGLRYGESAAAHDLQELGRAVRRFKPTRTTSH